MAINSKQKGSRVEREFATEFTKKFGQDFRRVPASGAHGTNIAESNIRQDAKEILSGDLITPIDFKFCVEIKARAAWNFWDLISNSKKSELYEWINQVENEALVSKKSPLLIIKVNARKPFVLLKLEPDIIEKCPILWGNYGIMKFEDLLKLDNTFFFKKEKK